MDRNYAKKEIYSDTNNYFWNWNFNFGFIYILKKIR